MCAVLCCVVQWEAYSKKDEADIYAAQQALRLDVVLQHAALLVSDEGENMPQQSSEEEEDAPRL